MDYSMLTNAEIRVKLKEFEDEYEAVKNKLEEYITKLEMLDSEYNTLSNILGKRTKGRF